MLTKLEIQNKIDDDAVGQGLRAIQRLQRRVRLHAKSFFVMSPEESSHCANEFLNYAKGILTKEKYTSFLALWRLPVETNALSNGIFKDLKKIFDGRNPTRISTFNQQNESEDFNSYKDIFDIQSFFEKECYEMFKTTISPVIVVDMKEEREAQPAPYAYLIEPSSFLYYKIKDGAIKTLVFRSSSTRVTVLDETSYRVYRTEENKDRLEDEIINNTHGLGECPARFLTEKPISHSLPELKEHPFTYYISMFDDLLLNMNFKRYADMYASFPILTVIKESCNFFDDEKNIKCQDGILYGFGNKGGYVPLFTGDKLSQCPKCSMSKYAGPGTIAKISSKKLESLKGVDPIKTISPDVSSLEYSTDKNEKLEAKIRDSICGVEVVQGNEVAKNETQVKTGLESKTSVIRYYSKAFAASEEWTTKIICKLRYLTHLNTIVDYGDTFYMLQPTEILDQYNEQKGRGQASYILDITESDFVQSKFRSNPDMLRRINLIKNIDPYRHQTVLECVDNYKNNIITNYKDLQLKINLSTLVLRFEREQGVSLAEFGRKLPFDKQTQKIKDILLSYIEEPNS